jgi:hypothetical protein
LVCGLLASAIIDGFIGLLLERPYSSGAGLFWGCTVGVGIFAWDLCPVLAGIGTTLLDSLSRYSY